MHKPTPPKATLPNLADSHLPPLEIAIDARCQFAVNCGAQAAMAFFGEDQAITLHAHLPASLAHFLEYSRRTATAIGADFGESVKGCTDAFCAGYLGRIQQELRIMRPGKPCARQAVLFTLH